MVCVWRSKTLSSPLAFKESFASGEDFLRAKRINRPSCLVLDVRLPQMSGLDFQQRLTETGLQIPIIFITAHGDIPMSVRALKSGALEFLTKAFPRSGSPGRNSPGAVNVTA